MGTVRLGDLLVRAGLITREQLQTALEIQAKTHVRLGQILIDHRVVPEDRVVDALAQASGLARLDLQTVPIEGAASRWVTPAWAQQHGVVPLSADRDKKVLYVAVSDPTDVGPLDELAFRSSLRVSPYLGSEHEVQHIIRHLYFGGELSRDPRARRSQPAPAESSGEVISGMAAMREHLQSQEPGPAGPAPRPSYLAPPPLSEQETITRLRALVEAQQEAARELQALFELCVQRGIIARQEYLERIGRLVD
ncbi:MAG: hypothetical protein U1E65_18930 [Myxococcota bacterium]